METMRLTVIADKLAKGQLADGTAFINTAGEKVIVKDGALHWLTKNGYVSNIVGITIDNYTDVWKITSMQAQKELTFAEALAFIDKGKEVRFETQAGEEFEVSGMVELDRALSLFVTIGHLYSGKAYDTEGQRVAEVKTVNEVKEDGPNVDGLLKAFGLREHKHATGAKLTDKDVYAIHYRRYYMKDSVAKLAEIFGVTERMVYYIIDGTFWKGVYKQFHNDYDVYR